MKCARPSGVANRPSGPRTGARRPTGPGRPCRAAARCLRRRHDAGDLVADGLRPRRSRISRAAVGSTAPRQVDEDLPLAARLADARPGDLGAEGDAPLGRGLGAAAALLVAGRGRQQHDDVARVDEHLARQTMSWCTRSGTVASAASTSGGSGSASRKLPPIEYRTSRRPSRRGSTISAARQAGLAAAPGSRTASASAAARLGRRRARRPGARSRTRPSRRRPARRSGRGSA